LRESHREAAGERGADEFLGVAALALLEPGLGGEVGLEPTLAGSHDAGAVAEGAFPASIRSTDSHISDASRSGSGSRPDAPVGAAPEFCARPPANRRCRA